MNNGFDLLAISDKTEDLCRTPHSRNTSSGLSIGECLVAKAVEVLDDVGPQRKRQKECWAGTLPANHSMQELV